MVTHQLSKDEARRIVVRAALLDADRPGDLVEVAEQIGQIKIDPTAVIAPCEHTVLWSRIGWSYEPGQLKKAVEQDRLGGLAGRAGDRAGLTARPARFLPAGHRCGTGARR